MRAVLVHSVALCRGKRHSADAAIEISRSRLASGRAPVHAHASRPGRAESIRHTCGGWNLPSGYTAKLAHLLSVPRADRFRYEFVQTPTWILLALRHEVDGIATPYFVFISGIYEPIMVVDDWGLKSRINLDEGHDLVDLSTCGALSLSLSSLWYLSYYMRRFDRIAVSSSVEPSNSSKCGHVWCGEWCHLVLRHATRCTLSDWPNAPSGMTIITWTAFDSYTYI